MSFHHDYQRWERMTRKENCPVCGGAPMPEGMVDVVELPASWLNAQPEVCLRGQVCVTSKVHAVELYDLTDDRLLAFMTDVSACAKALKKVTRAVKINYEIHGNTVPHLHVHLFPRSMDDPFPDQPIDYRQVRPDIYGEWEFDALVEELRRELAGRAA
jgi:diadenosine tetraphosphate (Ap4A) HIT family hydrolase